MSYSILIVTAIPKGESCAEELARQLRCAVAVASNRKAALSTLRRQEFTIVVVDDAIAESDTAGADLLWRHAGLAVPLQINFAISSVPRIAREVRSAIDRREQEQMLAMRAAASVLQSELKSTVAGLLLQSELALAEPSVPVSVTAKLRTVVELAGNLRQQLERAQAPA